MAKPSYSKPASTLDLEARQKPDYENRAVLIQGSDAEPSENGYIGVDPIYQTFASPTEAPHEAEKGAEAKLYDDAYADEVDFDAAATPEGVGEATEDAEQSQTSQTTGSGSSQSTAPGGSTTPAASNPPPKS